MKPFLKSALRGLLLSLWCVLLSAACILVYQHLFAPVRQAELETQHQALMSALSESQQASDQQRRAALDALTQTLDELSLRVDEQAQRLQALSNTQQHHSTRLDKLDLDHHKVAELEKKLARLNRVVSTPRPAPVQKTAKAATHTTAKKAPSSQANTSQASTNKDRRAKPSQPESVPAPFVLYDVQSRSGIRLAIVGQTNARTLSELSALRQGQSYRGWKIVSVFASSIEVQRQGQRTTLTMMEG
ncbi:hypothetical protein MKR81_27770 (plasmid) [Vibrio campbellii]|uniref:hypothetical protein n=1 Tax=Vibrio campbellii TaxID=680 RepID=UPI001F07DA9A|nr:hypothetical protein [Vibrio campbellii]UMM06960.1 hypothetical protein MKR81_27770 [Vibrio campbellii]